MDGSAQEDTTLHQTEQRHTYHGNLPSCKSGAREGKEHSEVV